MLSSLKSLNWRGFLGRPALPEPSIASVEALRQESVLLTGAGGSIGSALARRLIQLRPRQLVLLEASESRLYAAMKDLEELGRGDRPAGLLGSVDDSALLEEIFAAHAPRLVFHAAAFKHVPLLEDQPLAAMRNNVLGTEILTRVASRHGAKVVLLSTDKAVEPASVMGATKRVAEHIVRSAGGVVLRLGNVLATRDSVAEVFAAQIEAGGPLTVTDPAARRYFLTIEEAVDRLLAVSDLDEGSMTVPELAVEHYVTDLARFMIEALSPHQSIAIEFTGPRAGDKDREKLWGTTETAAIAGGGMIRIDSASINKDFLQVKLAAMGQAVANRNVAAALGHLINVVPDYSPSAAVQALAEQRRQRVSQ